MKRIIGLIAVATCLCGMLIGIRIHSALSRDPYRTLYVRTIVITNKTWSTQAYTGVDNQGNEWMFSNTNDWSIGETIYLIMDTQDTEDITDDIIIMENRAE